MRRLTGHRPGLVGRFSTWPRGARCTPKTPEIYPTALRATGSAGGGGHRPDRVRARAARRTADPRLGRHRPAVRDLRRGVPDRRGGRARAAGAPSAGTAGLSGTNHQRRSTPTSTAATPADEPRASVPAASLECAREPTCSHPSDDPHNAPPGSPVLPTSVACRFDFGVTVVPGRPLAQDTTAETVAGQRFPHRGGPAVGVAVTWSGEPLPARPCRTTQVVHGGTGQRCCTPPAQPLNGVKTCPVIGHS